MSKSEWNDDELNESERHALEAWTALPPPVGFADRVLAAREVAAPVVGRRRWPLVAAGLAVCAAAAVAFVVTRPASRAASGELVASARTTRSLGDRAVAVAEPSAALSWQIDDDGDAVIEQRAGDVFYRVDRGRSFVVHTPAGDVHVTGTCFRIEVEPMNTSKQLVLTGVVGAAVAAGIVVTVYEGHVLADAHGTRTEISAGHRAEIGTDGRTLVAATDDDRPGISARATLDEKTATREELLARAITQRNELARLRTRVAELEQASGGPDAQSSAEPGRPWHDPSPERLSHWAAECHVRADDPGLDGWQPAKSLGKNPRGLEPDELPGYNAALAEVQQQWRQLVRALYLEATNDLAGAENLSIDAMRGEILQKSAPGEHPRVMQKISAERAGLAQPPVDLSKTSPYERLVRAHIELGDQTEAAIAKQLGPERAAAIRGDAWDSRNDWSGCPD